MNLESFTVKNMPAPQKKQLCCWKTKLSFRLQLYSLQRSLQKAWARTEKDICIARLDNFVESEQKI